MNTADDKIRVRLRIEGRVQGVFFRASTQDHAQRLGVSGWVRNCSDGSVEVVAEGERAKIDNLIAWCRTGPRGAKVGDVQIRWEEFSGEFTDFRVTR